MKLPEVNLEALKQEMAENAKQRRAFVRMYAEWVSKTPNAVWSSQQNALVGSSGRARSKLLR